MKLPLFEIGEVMAPCMFSVKNKIHTSEGRSSTRQERKNDIKTKGGKFHHGFFSMEISK